MSILKWFNKPKWQNSNIQVRIAAIKSSNDPELINHLPQLVKHDPSEQVQLAALNKINDLEQFIDIASHHSSKKVCQAAHKKIIQWCETHDDSSLSRVVNLTTSNEVIQALASSAKNSEVRLAAIKKITQQGKLADLLTVERDVTIQQQILNQINQQKTLIRLLEVTQKKNPELSQMIAQKIKPDTDHKQQALTLCQQLEGVVHGKNHQITDLKTIKTEWQKISGHVDQTLNNRFNGAFDAARMILDPEHRNEFLEKQKQQRALTDLSETEQWLSSNNSATLGTLQSSINRLNEHDKAGLSETDQDRLSAVIEQLTQLMAEVQETQRVPEQAIKVVDNLSATLNQQTATNQQLKQFKKQWQQATRQASDTEAMNELHDKYKQLLGQLADKIEQSGEIRERSAQQAIELIGKAITEIEEGHLVNAKKFSNQIAELKKLAGPGHPLIRKHKYQLDQVWNRLKELRKWQKWSNDKVRNDIIQGIIDIHGQGLHPDAVLKKLKDSNEQWYALEDMEKLPGDKYPSRNHALWQQFREVSKAVFEPTQPYFEKRGEQQGAKLDEFNQLIEQMLNIDLSESNEQQLSSLNRKAIKSLKSLDQLPPKKRGATAKKIRKGINRIDDKLNEFYGHAEKRKMKLIEQAEQLQQEADLGSAIEQAKALQNQWKSAGVVKQYTERKLWKRFRKANDAVFNRRQDEQKAQNEAIRQQEKAVNSFIKAQEKQIKKLHESSALQELKSTIHKGWNELDIPSGYATHKLNQLTQLIDEQLKVLSQKDLIKDLDQQQALDEMLSEMEQKQATVDEQNAALEALQSTPDRLWISQRQDSLSAGDTEEKLNEILIAAEFLTGLNTPKAHMDQRMAYQVKVLSDRMSGGKNLKDHQQALKLLQDWQVTAKPDAEFLKANNKRIQKAIKALRSLILE
ncbi:DUF349 domain-containing protein [Marinicella sediminis]|uniref:DUF349 domain-containing protein n=1 Tax=Marinicella sediminis TaxID=1792834 RepID=A0ABV7J6A6_9GAMM|nr:DUF349 domain-containing protein [Marinicella sediminis]